MYWVVYLYVKDRFISNSVSKSMVSLSWRPLLLATLMLATALPSNAQSYTDGRFRDIHNCRGEDNFLYGKPSKTAVICQNPDLLYLVYEQYIQHPKQAGNYQWHWTLKVIPEEKTGHHLFVLKTSGVKGTSDRYFAKWMPSKTHLQESIGSEPGDVRTINRFIRTHAAEFDQFVKYYARWHRSYFPQPGAKEDCWAKAAKGQANPLDCAEAEGLPIN